WHETHRRSRKTPGPVFDAVVPAPAGPQRDLAHLRMLVRGDLAMVDCLARKDGFDMQEADVERARRLAVDKELGDGGAIHGARKSPSGFPLSSINQRAARSYTYPSTRRTRCDRKISARTPAVP